MTPKAASAFDKNAKLKDPVKLAEISLFEMDRRSFFAFLAHRSEIDFLGKGLEQTKSDSAPDVAFRVPSDDIFDSVLKGLPPLSYRCAQCLREYIDY